MLLAIGLLKKTKNKKQKKNKRKKKKKKRKYQNCIKSVSQIIPISTTEDVICCSNGYIYHFLDYIKLLLFVNANFIMSKNVEHSSEKTPRELTWRDLYKFHTSVIATHFFDQVQIFFFFAHCIVIKVTLETNC